MTISRKTSFILFWIVVALLLTFGLSRILANPTSPRDDRASPLVISEMVADNTAGLMDEDGDFSDWIEIHNQSNEHVDLRGWSLTDDPAQPGKWFFDSMMLAPDERLVVFASGKDQPRIRTIEQDGEIELLHTNFRLNADAGFLALYSPNARRYLDSTALSYPHQLRDVAYGRYQDATGGVGYGYFTTPTPGEPNGDSLIWKGTVEPVVFSVERGYYDAPFEVELTTTTPDAEIRYTTDGSDPTPSNSEVYSEPIQIDGTTTLRAAAFIPEFRPSSSVTHSYIFVDDVAAQPAQPDGFPTTWGQHHISFGGYTEGEPRQADYAMDQRIVLDPTYGPMLREGLLSIPAVSIVTDMENLDIYAKPGSRGPESERPASIELIYPGEREGVQINAGLRIQGGAGRWEFMPKHSFRLFFKREYGPSKLEHAVFPDSPVTEFETLVLRAGVDRSFAGHPPAPGESADHRLTTYTRDEWGRDTQLEISGVGSRGIFAHLYLNGLYWGLYNMVERPDMAFAASYMGGHKDEWYSVNHGGSVDGQMDRFSVLLQLIEEGGLADPEKYAVMLEFVDPVHFSDYVILNWYAGNRDWPANNWYVDVHNPAGRNLFFAWDMEDTWRDGAAIVLGVDEVPGAPFPNVIKLLFNALWENEEYRLLFADRLHKHLTHDGTLTAERSQARWKAINEEIETAIVAESARWGDVRYDTPITQQDWLNARDNVFQQMAQNDRRLLELAREAGYYPAIKPPQLSPHGGLFDEAVAVEMTANDGEVFYTVDGSDPRTPGSGAVNPTARQYDQPIAIETAATIKARTQSDGQWSALSEASFRRGDQRDDVRFTEIMYNPGDKRYEFIELKNVGAVDADLSHAWFEGVNFRFPNYVVLPAGQHLVLVSNFKKFRQRYPDVEIYGVYEGNLADRGETLTLRAADGDVLVTVSYDDEGGWPLSADGLGDSLVLVSTIGSSDDPDSWQASADVHGSPGTDDPATLAVDPQPTPADGSR